MNIYHYLNMFQTIYLLFVCHFPWKNYCLIKSQENKFVEEL